MTSRSAPGARARSRALGLAAALGLGLAAPLPALAAPPQDAPSWSRQLFKQAETLANEGKWKDACPFFQAAHDLHATGGTALRTADCYEKIASYPQALEMYKYVVSHAAADQVPERVKLATARVEALEKQLRADVERTEITRVPVEPPPAEGSKTPAIVMFSVSGTGAVLAAVFGGLALAEAAGVKADAAVRCPGDVCNDPDLASRKSGATTKAWVANIGIGVAVAAAVVGTVLIVTAQSSKPKQAAARRALQTVLGPQGLALRF